MEEFKKKEWYKDWIKLLGEVLNKNGMQKSKIEGFCIGIELIRVKTRYKKFSNVITICTSAGINDWYVTNVHNLGGK